MKGVQAGILKTNLLDPWEGPEADSVAVKSPTQTGTPGMRGEPAGSDPVLLCDADPAPS